jgi:uncharacterized protein
LGPVTGGERIEILDILRGFAMFGVLYANMHNFGAWHVLTDRGWHDAAVTFQQFFIAHKFFSLFSFLFGIGFALQCRRARSRGASFFRVYRRRLLWLFLIGSLHVLIYPGDIVRLYAVLGFFLFLFHRRSSRILVLAACVFFLVNPTRVMLFESDALQWSVPDPETSFMDMQEQRRQALEGWSIRQQQERAYANGTPADVALTNLTNWPRHKSVFLRYSGPAFALFLLGLYADRRRLFEDVPANRRFIRRVMWWGLALGVVGNVAYTVVWWEKIPRLLPPVWGPVILEFIAAFGIPAMTLFYVSAMTLLAQRRVWRRALSPLAAVGRMALTAYVFQSVFYTTLYYGYGLGMYGKLGGAHILLLAVVVFPIEILLCSLWLRRYRFGPLEWLWRSLTYMKLQPMRRNNEPSPAAV